jgi:4-amino-4-deoxy-L-arabinose transferase-like glycosyltransferase
MPPIYDFTPFPAYIMALIYKAFSPDPLNFRIFNILLGVLTCGLIYLIGQELAGRLTGFAAGLIAALYRPFIFFSITALKTALSVFLFAAVIYLFIIFLTRQSTFILPLLGAAAGLMLNVRANFIVVLPLIPVLILCHRYRCQNSAKTISRELLLYALGLIIAVSPFIIDTYRTSGRLTLTATGGFNLYIANNLLNPIPYYRPVPFATSYPGTQAIQFVIEASQKAGRKLSPAEASSYWTGQVMQMALAQPAAILKKIGYKTLAFFNRFESADNYHIGFLSRYVKFFKLPFFGIALILPFGFAGMVIGAVQDRRVLFLSLIFLCYGSTLIIFFTNIRIRLPLLVILIPMAVMGFQKAIQNGRQGHRKFAAAYFIVAAVLFVAEYLPLPGTDDISGYYNTHAICLNSSGRKNEAMAYWEMSSQMNRSYSAYANLSLANIYRRRNDYDKAVSYLNKISDSSFAAADKYEMIGDMLVNQHQTGKAIAAYEKSLAINSGRRRPRRKLLRLLKNFDRKRYSTQHQKLLYISSFYKKR